jgi:hypothetical protein
VNRAAMWQEAHDRASKALDIAGVASVFSELFSGVHRNRTTFISMCEQRNRFGCSGQVLSNQQAVPLFSLKTGAHAPRGGVLSKMNVRPSLKEAALVQRMIFWRLRAKHGPIGNCSKSRGRKNYLALIRRHPVLAERHGLRETDIF